MAFWPLLGLLVLLAPLAAIYGLKKARRARDSVAAGRCSLLSQGLRMLLLPALVLVCAGMAGREYGWIDAGHRAAETGIGAVPPTFYTGNPLVDLLVWLALSFGNLALILFFASIPYLLGSLIALALLLADRLGALTLGPTDAPDDSTGAS
jgi:hypothetical protein